MELFSQRFYNYLAGSTDFGNVSFKIPGIHPFFYIGTDALNHTEEYTEAAGTSARLRRGMNTLFLLMKVNCIRCLKPSSCFQVTWFVCLVFFLFTSYPPCRRSFSFHARSWKGPVVHPEDSQSPGDDSCGRGVLPRSVAASERGLQAGKAKNGELSKGQWHNLGGAPKNDDIHRVDEATVISSDGWSSSQSGSALQWEEKMMNPTSMNMLWQIYWWEFVL